MRQKPRGTKAQRDKPPQGQKPMEDNIPGYRIPGGQNPKICVFVFVLGTRVPVSTVARLRGPKGMTGDVTEVASEVTCSTGNQV